MRFRVKYSKTKDYEIGVYSFPAWHLALKRTMHRHHSVW